MGRSQSSGKSTAAERRLRSTADVPRPAAVARPVACAVDSARAHRVDGSSPRTGHGNHARPSAVTAPIALSPANKASSVSGTWPAAAHMNAMRRRNQRHLGAKRGASGKARAERRKRRLDFAILQLAPVVEIRCSPTSGAPPRRPLNVLPGACSRPELIHFPIDRRRCRGNFPSLRFRGRPPAPSATAQTRSHRRTDMPADV